MKPPSFRIVLGQSDAVGASLWSTVRTRLPIPSSVPECIRAPAKASCRSFELRGRTAPAANVRRPGDSHKDASARLQRIHECASAPKLQRRQAYLFPFGIGWWNTRAAFAFLSNGIPILERRYAMTIQQLNNRHYDWKLRRPRQSRPFSGILNNELLAQRAPRGVGSSWRLPLRGHDLPIIGGWLPACA